MHTKKDINIIKYQSMNIVMFTDKQNNLKKKNFFLKVSVHYITYSHKIGQKLKQCNLAAKLGGTSFRDVAAAVAAVRIIRRHRASPQSNETTFRQKMMRDLFAVNYNTDFIVDKSYLYEKYDKRICFLFICPTLNKYIVFKFLRVFINNHFFLITNNTYVIRISSF